MLVVINFLGWIVKLKMNNIEELDNLMNEEEYDKFVREIDSEWFISAASELSLLFLELKDL